jgi:DNA segregation ATPase FtsK/SpoIIIE-like protein
MKIKEFTKNYIKNLQNMLDMIDVNVVGQIVEQLEKMGVLSPPNNKGNREIING